MDIDGARIDIDVSAPDPIQKLFARPDPARFFHEGRQKTKLGRSQFDRLLGARDPVGFSVKDDVPELKTFADTGRSDAAQLGAHPRHQFDHRIGFDHIIVRPGFKPPHPVGLLGAGCQHDDRNVARCGVGLQAPADLDARDAGQHPVKDDDVRLDFRDQQ